MTARLAQYFPVAAPAFPRHHLHNHHHLQQHPSVQHGTELHTKVEPRLQGRTLEFRWYHRTDWGLWLNKNDKVS